MFVLIQLLIYIKCVTSNERIDTSKVINVLDKTLWNCDTINFD